MNSLSSQFARLLPFSSPLISSVSSFLLPAISLNFGFKQGFATVAGDNQEKRRSLIRSVVDIRRTAKVTEGGKIISFSVLVVVGNGRGGAGYALGKALSVIAAMKKATAKATKNMRFIPRYMNSTIYHQIDHQFHHSKIRLWPADMEYGLRVNHSIQSICHCAGITALGGKVHGSRNVINVVRGTFEALESQESHLERARRLGLRAIDLNQTFFDYQQELNNNYNEMQLQLLKNKVFQGNNPNRSPNLNRLALSAAEGDDDGDDYPQTGNKKQRNNFNKPKIN